MDYMNYMDYMDYMDYTHTGLDTKIFLFNLTDFYTNISCSNSRIPQRILEWYLRRSSGVIGSNSLELVKVRIEEGSIIY